MQTGGLYPNFLYQHPYHPVVPVSQDHELKKQYLALLPPTQIIDICLNFDSHVPPYVKNIIWPPDINAAIVALKKIASAPDKETRHESQEGSPSGNKPPENPPTDTGSTITDQPSSSEQQPPPPPAPSQTPQQPPQPPHPYGYPPLHTAYPHSPYYPHPTGYPVYPGYPPYHPVPGYPAPQQPTGYPQSAQASCSFNHPPVLLAQSLAQDPFGGFPTEDLPSYEDMIAEALLDSNDPEGCAPKSLFTWMAARYPLQSNFRPSASQALQKAFKRGRFLKTSSGKYRINTEWGGAPTSRRTTRRPQTHNQASTPQGGSGSPFTHAPLVHNQNSSKTSNQAVYPYGYPLGFSGYAPHPPPPTTECQPTEMTRGLHSSNTDQSDDPYEAAQNILKAINFGSLLKLPAEDGTPGGATDTPESPVGLPGADRCVENPRVKLQAQLALLAAQLADFAQDGEGQTTTTQTKPSGVHSLQPSTTTTVDNSALIMASLVPPAPSSIGVVTDEGEETSDGDMEVVI